MEFSPPQTSDLVLKECKRPLLSSYPIIRPTETSFSLKNFKNAVDFQPIEKLLCESTWYRDVKSTYIRNKRLLDLPYKRPKCCFDIYNISIDRQKLKKIQKYGLTRPMKTRTWSKVEKMKTCEPKRITEGTDITYVPECYKVEDSSSDEESDEYESCRSGSVSVCPGCFGETRTKMHKIIKKDFRELLHAGDEICRAKVAEEIIKHKLGEDFILKMNKVF